MRQTFLLTFLQRNEKWSISITDIFSLYFSLTTGSRLMAYSANISFESTFLSPALVFPCDSFDKLTPSWNFNPPTWRLPRFQNLLDVTRTGSSIKGQVLDLKTLPVFSPLKISVIAFLTNFFKRHGVAIMEFPN